MSYVRWSSKVIHDCDVCGNEHWVAYLPEHPDWLSFSPDKEKYPDITADDYPRLPQCCTSCWYIYDDCGGYLQLYHGARCCHDGTGSEQLHTVEEARAWSPPEDCTHRQVAIDCVNEWIEEQG